MTESEAPVVIVAGAGEAPWELARRFEAESRRYAVLALHGIADSVPVVLKPEAVVSLPIHRLGLLLAWLSERGYSRLVMLGSVPAQPWRFGWPDAEARNLLQSLYRKRLRGDRAWLEVLNDWLCSRGFRLLSLAEVAEGWITRVGIYTTLGFADDQRRDASIAMRGARTIGWLDGGQAAIAVGGNLWGVEDRLGTQALLRRHGPWVSDGGRRTREGVLAKCAKPGQSLAEDPPVVGLETVKLAASVGLAGIVMEAGSVLWLQQDACVAEANRCGMTIAVLPPLESFLEADADEGWPEAVWRALPLHGSEVLRLWVSAAETSGDCLAAGCLRVFLADCRARGQLVEVAGLGGPLLLSAGLPQSVMPMERWSVMGWTELWRKILWLWWSMRVLAKRMQSFAPHAILTVDAPSLHGRLLACVTRGMGRRLQYVAPSVWAYRPERAKQWASWVDRIALLFPCERGYFDAVGLVNRWVGHRALSVFGELRDSEASRGNLLLLCPGSRLQECRILWPIFSEAVRLSGVEAMVGVAVTSTTRSWIAKRMADQGLDWTVLEGPEALASWGSRARWALTKSGTVTLELALQGVPMMVAHRVHAWTVWWLRRRWRVERVALPNILLQQSVVPEYIQERCEAGILADALRQAWDDGEARDRQSEAFRGLRDCLVGENPGVSPDNQAACWLSAMLWGSENEKRRPSDG